MFRTLMLAFSLVMFMACQTLQPSLSRDAIIQRGTRIYKGVPLNNSIKASVIALEKLGFSITKQNSVSRAALITTDQHEVEHKQFSWSLLLFSDGKDVEIQARPQAFNDGIEISDENFSAEMIDPRFKDLWSEIEANLGR